MADKKAVSKTGEQYEKFNGVEYLPSAVGKMTPQAFAEQHAHLWAGHGSQADQLAAMHSEATRINAENTKKSTPGKELDEKKK